MTRSRNPTIVAVTAHITKHLRRFIKSNGQQFAIKIKNQASFSSSGHHSTSIEGIVIPPVGHPYPIMYSEVRRDHIHATARSILTSAIFYLADPESIGQALELMKKSIENGFSTIKPLVSN
jgi:hypothetical protein